jgi:hypothetical protein
LNGNKATGMAFYWHMCLELKLVCQKAASGDIILWIERGSKIHKAWSADHD